MPGRSFDLMATYDAFGMLPLIGSRPVLLVVGTRAVTSWMSVEAFGRLIGPKELHFVEGASHVDLYDREEHLGPVVAKLADFFAESLLSR